MAAISEEDKSPVRTDLIQAFSESGWTAFVNPRMYHMIYVADFNTSRMKDELKKKFNLPASMKVVVFSAPNMSPMYVIDTPVEETFKRLEKMGIFMNKIKID